MNDLEMTRLCAEAMRLATYENHAGTLTINGHKYKSYWPLRDAAQCFALVKRFPHLCLPAMTLAMFESCDDIGPNAKPVDFNRVIVECVAKMQKAKA